MLVSTVLMAVAVAMAAPPKTSERYAFSTFREQAGRVSVFVDGYPASQRTEDPYVPIPIAIAAHACPTHARIPSTPTVRRWP